MKSFIRKENLYYCLMNTILLPYYMLIYLLGFVSIINVLNSKTFTFITMMFFLFLICIPNILKTINFFKKVEDEVLEHTNKILIFISMHFTITIILTTILFLYLTTLF